MAFHQILGQKKIADRRQNGREQNTNGSFALVEQIAHEVEGKGGVVTCQRIAEFENHRRPRNWYEGAHLLGRDRTVRCIER